MENQGSGPAGAAVEATADASLDAISGLTEVELQRFLEAKAALVAAGGVQQSVAVVLFSAATG